MGKLKKILSYFNVKYPGDIIWAHRVNSEKKLKEACNSESVMMIEGDIIYSPESKKVVMAHPPERRSDLSFDEWLKEIIDKGKGAKLDFKDPRVISSCLKKVKELKPDVPIVIHADTVKGPGGEKPIINTNEFLKQIKNTYPQGLISIGWTTEIDPKEKYKKNYIEDMLKATEKVKEDITYPVRAYYLPKSLEEVKLLLKDPTTTITIWNNEVLPKDLLELIKKETDPERTFYDLIDPREGKAIKIK